MMNNQEAKTLLKIIGLKQEKTLLNWLFRPLWVTLTGTTVLITVCLMFSVTFFMVIMLVPLIAYGIYMSHKCHNRLKEIKKFDLNLKYMK